MQSAAQPVPGTVGDSLVNRASHLTVGALLRNQAQRIPQSIALDDGTRTLSFHQLNVRVNQLVSLLRQYGVRRGERIAICSENRIEYLELTFAAAKLGAILATLNWRLAGNELSYCIDLVDPRVVFCSPRFQFNTDAQSGGRPVVAFDHSLDERIAACSSDEPTDHVEPEDGLLIIYTSGTTGRPKAALLSHRAEIARMLVNTLDFDLRPGDAFVAWPPMFHMISTEQCIHVICLGGTAVIVDGFDLERLLREIAERPQWWLVLMPGMAEQVAQAVRERGIRPKGIRIIGVMADLVPRHQLAELTTLLGAPYCNTFGSTETGLPPASGGRIAIGVVPDSLSKTANVLCDFRLVDEHDCDVPEGVAGELAFRGPTLFSGYWNAPEVNEREFRGGWYHMGDMFVRSPGGSLNFADRAKYLIKSGGENIYPAEIERVVLSDPRVRDAVVVRRPDPKWGEIPIAVVAANDASLTAVDIVNLCRAELAGYKCPRGVLFIDEERFPRSTTGKIQRHEIENWADVLALEV